MASSLTQLNNIRICTASRDSRVCNICIRSFIFKCPPVCQVWILVRLVTKLSVSAGSSDDGCFGIFAVVIIHRTWKVLFWFPAFLFYYILWFVFVYMVTVWIGDNTWLEISISLEIIVASSTVMYRFVSLFNLGKFTKKMV